MEKVFQLGTAGVYVDGPEKKVPLDSSLFLYIYLKNIDTYSQRREEWEREANKITRKIQDRLVGEGEKKKKEKG